MLRSIVPFTTVLRHVFDHVCRLSRLVCADTCFFVDLRKMVLPRVTIKDDFIVSTAVAVIGVHVEGTGRVVMNSLLWSKHSGRRVYVLTYGETGRVQDGGV